MLDAQHSTQSQDINLNIYAIFNTYAFLIHNSELRLAH